MSKEHSDLKALKYRLENRLKYIQSKAERLLIKLEKLNKENLETEKMLDAVEQELQGGSNENI